MCSSLVVSLPQASGVTRASCVFCGLLWIIHRLCFGLLTTSPSQRVVMEPACRKDKPKLNSTPTRGDRAKQKSAQQELKQRQRAEIYALNKVMTELEQQQFEAFCKQMQSQGE
ncbi:small vasohibin-binding protein isoform X1 [Micropterus dolomieu]|nr:small vasohibin-binding protein isoform X1 [Micropterus dolomieu]